VSGERKLRPATLAAQALGWIEPTTRAVVPSLHVATTYQRDADGLDRSWMACAEFAMRPAFCPVSLTQGVFVGPKLAKRPA